MKRNSILVKQELATFLACGHGLASSDWATQLLRNKLDGNPLRAYFVSKMAEQLWDKARFIYKARHSQNTWEKLLYRQLPFAFEVVITIQYLHNQILDGKSNVTSREQVSKNLLAANLLKEQLYCYLEETLPSWAQQTTIRSIRKCFEWVDHGQHLEQSANTYHAFMKGQKTTDYSLPPTIVAEMDFSGAEAFLDKLSSDLPLILHDQLHIYFQRIYLTCATLFIESSRLLGQLLRISDRQLKPFLGFSLCYGLMRQLVNDNADWTPSSYGLHTATKTTADTFSDLRNGTLTLPLLFFLAEHKNSLSQQLLNKKICWSQAFELPIFEELLQSNALYKSIQNTRILAELALAYIPDEHPASAFLAESCEIVHWNKFLAPALKHPIYQTYRKTGYHLRTKRLIKVLRQERKQSFAQQQVAKLVFSFPWRQQEVLPTAVGQLEQLLRCETY
ncbi:MAG: hypothetical protein AAGJ93_05610 [Bacteroidota bacterium]